MIIISIGRKLQTQVDHCKRIIVSLESQVQSMPYVAAAQVPQGRIPEGGGGGTWESGPPLPPFWPWGTPKLHKEGKNVAHVRAKSHILVLNSYLDPPPPHFKNPVSAVRNCLQPSMSRLQAKMGIYSHRLSRALKGICYLC